MEDTTKQKEKKPFPLRLVLFFVISILLISGIWYGSYWYTSTTKTLTEANQRIGQANAYEVLTQKIEEEHRRCQQFIAQESGEFGEFQYCQRYINWVESISTTPAPSPTE